MTVPQALSRRDWKLIEYLDGTDDSNSTIANDLSESINFTGKEKVRLPI